MKEVQILKLANNQHNQTSDTYCQSLQITYYCFNPTCQWPQVRLFSIAHQHYQSKSCKKWFIKNDFNIKSNEFVNNKFNNVNGLDFNFFESPIETIKLAYTLNNKVIQELTHLFHKIRDNINAMIDIIEKIAIQKLKNIFNFSQKIYDKIKQLLNQNQSNNQSYLSSKISQFSKKQFNDLDQLNNWNILNKQKIDQQLIIIKTQIQKILIGIKSQKISNSYYLNLKQLKQLVSFINGNGDIGKQMQCLIKLLKINIKQVIINNDKQQIKIVCPCCFQVQRFQSLSTKEMKKKGISFLIEHLISEHTDQLLFYFKRRIAKTVIKPISISQILYLMRNHNYNSLEIIDGSIPLALKQPTYQRDCKTLRIEFVNYYKERPQNPYIILNQSQTLPTITILLYLVSLEYKKQCHIVSFSKKYQSIIDFIKKQGGKVSRETIKNQQGSMDSKEEFTQINQECSY